MKTLKIGDTVQWRGAWGADEPRPAIVRGIEVTEHPREKYGQAVTEVDWSIVRENRAVIDLDNGSWAYGSQITEAQA